MQTQLVESHAAKRYWTQLCVANHLISRLESHWMMTGKARLFADEDALERILVAPDPKSAKAIGREVRGFD